MSTAFGAAAPIWDLNDMEGMYRYERRRMSVSRRVGLVLFGLFCLLMATVDLPRLFGSGELEVVFFDVGQGDAAGVFFPDGTVMLVDTGVRAAASSLSAKLRARGASRVDILVATHHHEDHIGGADAIIRGMSVGEVWDCGMRGASGALRRMLEAVRDSGARFVVVGAGRGEEIGGARVEVIAPVRPVSGTRSEANDNSIIMRISYGERSFLLMADAEEAERESVGEFPRSTVIKLAHHGSRNGTDERLMREVRPEAAVISCGAINDYGHPHKETTELLDRIGAASYRTSDGDICCRTDGRQLYIEQ